MLFISSGAANRAHEKDGRRARGQEEAAAVSAVLCHNLQASSLQHQNRRSPWPIAWEPGAHLKTYLLVWNWDCR